MSITEINDTLSDIMANIWQFKNVDTAQLEAVRNKLEDVQEMLDRIADEYGDEVYEDDDTLDDEDDYDEA